MSFEMKTLKSFFCVIGRADFKNDNLSVPFRRLKWMKDFIALSGIQPLSIIHNKLEWLNGSLIDEGFYPMDVASAMAVRALLQVDSMNVSNFSTHTLFYFSLFIY